jgi:Protein of unknown function (DUF1579)
VKRASATSLIFVLYLAALSIQSFAQMPTPAPELKKLDALVGTWNSEGDLKPGPMGPGGKMTMAEKYKWMPGGFFLVLHTTFKSDMMDGSGTSFMGYNSDDKQYTYDEFDSMGERAHSTGAVDGDTWTWSGEEKMGGRMMKNHFIMKMVSPTAYSYKYEVSQDGTTWTTVMDGKATKAK